ncbi:hypothetical protein [Ralstonia solanacearum]|uniref:hypothetical protein n=1 Tax=Ralstonia solanacearum TaxID=305 RepID=UPI0011C3477E|nr:hypothetical protein [Ralstonia solanacearum]
MNDTLYLGKVLFVGDTFARLGPLAFESNGRWVPIADKATLFPPDGKVFSPGRRLRGAVTDSMWTFRRRANERIEPGKDDFLVDEAHEAIPIVNLSELPIEQARQRLFNQGVSVASPYEYTQALVILAGGLSCTLGLSQSEDGFWRAEPASSPVPLFAIPREWANLRAGEELSYVPANSAPTSSPVKFVNWCGDKEFVERILDQFRKHSQNVAEGKYGRLSKESVQHIARALERAELFPGNEEDVALNFERLKASWPILEARLAASEQLSDFVLESSVAKNVIDAAARAAEQRTSELVREKVEQQVRRELEATLTDVVVRRDEITKDLASLTQRRASLEEELREIERLCALGRDEQRALSLGIQGIVRNLRDAFEGVPSLELSAARTIVGRLEQVIGENAGPPSLMPSYVAPWAKRIECPGTVDIEYTALTSRMQAEAVAHAVAVNDLLLIDAFARGGELLLLLGPQSELALAAYARCITSGAVRFFHLDPSVIGLEDLWRIPGTQQPTAMAYAWNAAEAEPDRFHIVCLRNIDAAPLHLWLKSLSAVLQSTSRPRNLLFFATLAASQQDQKGRPTGGSCPYQEWLIPIQVGVHPDGALSALASVATPSSPVSRLSPDSPVAIEDALSPDWLKQVALLKAEPTLVVRMARLTEAVLRVSSAELQSCIFSWARFLNSSAEPDALPLSLRAGYATLESIAQQR